MIIQWEGREWQFPWKTVKTSVAVIVGQDTGHKWPVELFQAAGDFDPRAVMAVCWVMKTLNGWQGTIDECDVEMVTFMEAFNEGFTAENPPEAEDPQPPVAEDGSTPGTSSTSETST